MTVRMPVVCISCDSKIITRTQIGHKDMQKHSFPCPTCGVVITYILDLDQKNAGYKFREPENGKWADDEDGAIKTLTFSDEIVVPAGLPDFVSPFIATLGPLRLGEIPRRRGIAPVVPTRHLPLRGALPRPFRARQLGAFRQGIALLTRWSGHAEEPFD